MSRRSLPARPCRRPSGGGRARSSRSSDGPPPAGRAGRSPRASRPATASDSSRRRVQPPEPAGSSGSDAACGVRVVPARLPVGRATARSRGAATSATSRLATNRAARSSSSSGWVGRSPSTPKLLGRGHEPPAEVPAPDPVHDHPGGQRVASVDDRVGQFQPAAPVPERPRLAGREHRQEPPRDDRPGSRVAPDEHGQVAACPADVEHRQAGSRRHPRPASRTRSRRPS